MPATIESAIEGKKARVAKLRLLLEDLPAEKALARLAVDEGVSIKTARRYLDELDQAGLLYTHTQKDDKS